MFAWRQGLFPFLLIAILISLFGCKPDAMDDYGQPISISNYRGKWVVINYWATWCAPCINEIPDLIKLKKFYGDKVVVLGVNLDNLDNRVLRSLGDEYEVNYPLLNNFPIEKWAKRPQKLPMTYIFNPQGKLAYTLNEQQTLINFQKLMNLPAISYDK